MKVLKIIFIVICLLFLLLPLVFFDFHSEISIEENKMLQRFPKLFNNRELNKNSHLKIDTLMEGGKNLYVGKAQKNKKARN